MENVIIPNTVTTIEDYAFEGCASFTAMDIPQSVSSIGVGVFQNCKNLRNVTFHENATTGFELKIYGYVFNGCTKLAELFLPETVTYLGDHMIQGTAISSITVPKNVKKVGDNGGGPFAGDINLSYVTLEEGMTSVPNRLLNFYQSPSYVERVNIPSTVTTIEDFAFEGCTRLKELYLPDGVVSIGNNSFKNCHNLQVYCSESSPALAHLIDNDVHFILTRDITFYEHFVYGDTDYYSDISTMTGYVPFVVKYEQKAETNMENKRLVIRIPQSSSLIESTLKLYDVLLTDYEYKDNLLTIPINSDKGTLTFCVQPSEYTTLLSYAKMDYQDGEINKSEIIGVLNCSVPDISIKADNITNSSSVLVEGIASPDSIVDFYVGDDKVGSTNTIKSGNYTTTITLPETENYKTYTITAQTEKAGERVDAETSVTYRDSAPALKSLIMSYGNHTNTYRYNLTDSTIKPTLIFNPSLGFRFEAKFDNIDAIEKVYIVSTRSNQKKYMEAVWDPGIQAYVAEGVFDGTNRNYVPGEISVEYLPKSEPFLFSKEIDFTSAQYTNTLPEEWDGCEITLTNDEGEPEAQIAITSASNDSLSGKVTFLKDIKGALDFNILSKVIPSYLKPENAADYGYNKVVDEAGEELYVKVANEAESKLQAEVVSFAQEKMSDFLIENKAYGLDTALDQLNSVTSVLGDVDKFITFDNNRVDINAARQKVLNTPMSPEEKQMRLKRLEIAEKSNYADIALLCVTGALAASGIALPLACSLVVSGLSYQNTADIEFALGTWEMLATWEIGTGYSCKWSIDPSGYVYEGVTSNRLEGVTATAYYIAPDYINEDGSFDESSTVLWDASEYNQMNPLITDKNGAYAWDVPEGLWQVKYEKDGYETQLSEWLPVPPPQTNVNIGLVSKTAPKVESAVLTSENLTITFDKYMKPETVTNISIGGNEYTLSYPTNETAPDGTVYARKFVCTLKTPLQAGSNAAVKISGAESYAGVRMSDYSANLSSGEAAPESYDINIENASESNMTISADFKNNTDRYQTFEAICAVYDGEGVLLDTKTTMVVALGADDSTNKTFEFDRAFASYKIFAWSDTDSMIPIAEAVSN